MGGEGEEGWETLKEVLKGWDTGEKKQKTTT